MSEALEREKAMIEEQHKNGYKVLIIGQPLAGKDVPKKTYMSCMNMFNPLALIELLERLKVMTSIKIMSDFPIDANRNRYVRDALYVGADYLFFMDMDQTFPVNTLPLLFENISDEKPVISGMYFLKSEPYSPVMGKYVDWADDLIPHKETFDKLGFVHPDGRQLVMWRPFTYFDKDKLFRADVIGLGCVLMKADIFKNLEYPWFRYVPDPRGGHEHKTMDEVMFLCADMAKKGIPIHVDPRVQCGHITQIESNVQIFEEYRDSSFRMAIKESPEKFEKMAQLFIDAREEQRNGITTDTLKPATLVC